MYLVTMTKKVLKLYKGTELLKLPMLKVAIDYLTPFSSD